MELVFRAMTALAPFDLPAMEKLAVAWARKNPGVDVAKMTRCRRVADPGARACYAKVTMAEAQMAQGKLNGQHAAPCVWCGQWTHCFCEACDINAGAPQAICVACDSDKLICHECLCCQRTWEKANAKHKGSNEGNFVEVSGYVDGDGIFHKCNPPLNISTEGIPRAADGTFDLEQLSEKILAAAQQQQESK